MREGSARTVTMLRVACLLLMGLWPAAIAWFWLLGDADAIWRIVPGKQGALDAATRVTCLAAFGPTLLAICYGLQQARSVATLLGADRAVSTAGIAGLRRLGVAMVSGAALNVVGNTMAVLALTIQNPPGQRLIVLTVGDATVLALLCGGLMFAIARGFEAAKIVADDHAAIV